MYFVLSGVETGCYRLIGEPNQRYFSAFGGASSGASSSRVGGGNGLAAPRAPDFPLINREETDNLTRIANPN